jgi:hypothetical protein
MGAVSSRSISHNSARVAWLTQQETPCLRGVGARQGCQDIGRRQSPAEGSTFSGDKAENHSAHDIAAVGLCCNEVFTDE